MELQSSGIFKPRTQSEDGKKRPHVSREVTAGAPTDDTPPPSSSPRLNIVCFNQQLATNCQWVSHLRGVNRVSYRTSVCTVAEIASLIARLRSWMFRSNVCGWLLCRTIL